MRKYEKYKPSGIEWLGEIPEHWEVKRVKEIFRNIGSGTTPPSGDQTYYEDFGINWLQTGDLNDGYILETSKKVTQKARDEYSTLKLYPKESLVIAMYGATIGKMGYLKIKTTTNQACCVLSYLKYNNERYVFYQLLSMKSFVISLSTGGGQPNINQDIVKFLKITLPSFVEQTAIANYLDTKTAAIDRKIELLTAKADKYKALRRSLINETVCRGLNPNASLKDSGIEWIGMIPEHWEVDRLKNLCIYISRGITPDYVENSEFKVINQATFSQGFFDEENIKFTTKSDKRAEAKVNDIIVASTGGGVLGKVYFIDVLSGKYFSDSHVTTIRTNLNRLNPKYLFYFLSINFDLINGIMAKGSTNQTELQRDSLLGFNWCIPPIEEQTAIAQYLNEKTTQIDTILTNINNQINKLTQLRKTLINDVVTGKIKVAD